MQFLIQRISLLGILDVPTEQSPEVFYKKGVLKNFAKFTGKHLCQSLSFNKVAGLWHATLLKKRLWDRRFPVNFAKFLITPFLQNTSGRLLLSLILKFFKLFSYCPCRPYDRVGAGGDNSTPILLLDNNENYAFIGIK